MLKVVDMVERVKELSVEVKLVEAAKVAKRDENGKESEKG